MSRTTLALVLWQSTSHSIISAIIIINTQRHQSHHSIVIIGMLANRKRSTQIRALLDLILRVMMVSVMLYNVWETNENATESKFYGN